MSDDPPTATWRRAGAYVACRDADDRLLLARFHEPGNPDSGRWTMPGGGMDWGESPAETAVRELEEETGLEADLGSVIGVWSRWVEAGETPRGEPGHVIGLIYSASNPTGRLRDEVNGTTDAADWFTLDEVRTLPRVPLVDFVLDLLAQ